MLCRQALKPRLLVAVALAAGMGLYNSQAEQPLGRAEEFSLLGGFFSYKVRTSRMAKSRVVPESVWHESGHMYVHCKMIVYISGK